MEKITQFNNEYSWLSTSHPCTVVLHGKEYESVEHAYLSAKCNETSWKMACSWGSRTSLPKLRKKNVRLVDNWEQIRFVVMERCLRQKFNQEPFKSKLIETGNAELEEGNLMGETFWGVCLLTKKGENNLGKMIMKIRKELQK